MFCTFPGAFSNMYHDYIMIHCLKEFGENSEEAKVALGCMLNNSFISSKFTPCIKF